MRKRLLSAAATIVLLLVSCAPAFAQSETIEYYALDALGSVRVIFDQQGNVVDRMDYGPFGENLRAAIKFPTEQFAQLARDAESGQDYAEARHYSAATGRFNRLDPIYAGLFTPQSWNRYVYALSNPLRYQDPSGLEPCGEFRFCVEIIEELRNGTDAGELFYAIDEIGPEGGQTRPDGQGPALTPGPLPSPVPGPDGTPGADAPTAGETSSWQRTMQCAAAGAEDLSMLSGLNKLGVPSNFWTRSLFGNDAATISNIITGPNRLESMVDVLPANALGVAVARAGNVYDDVARFRLHKTTGEPYVERFSRRAVAKNAFGLTIGAAFKIVSSVKLAWDVGTYTGSLIACKTGLR